MLVMSDFDSVKEQMEAQEFKREIADMFPEFIYGYDNDYFMSNFYLSEE